MRYFISIIFLIQLSTVEAQKNKVDTLRRDFLPSAIRLSTDLISIIRSQTDKTFTGYEVNADVDFYRYYLTLDAGRWKRELASEVDRYTNAGNFMRIGVDVNFLTKDPEKNMFFIGARFGWGKFDENFSVSYVDPVWGSGTNTFSNNNVKATWGELTTGLKVKIWKFFWMGYTARFKFGLNTNESGDFVSHDVPGYGKTGFNTTWGFNYQVMFNIPFRSTQSKLKFSRKILGQ